MKGTIAALFANAEQERKRRMSFSAQFILQLFPPLVRSAAAARPAAIHELIIFENV